MDTVRTWWCSRSRIQIRGHFYLHAVSMEDTEVIVKSLYPYLLNIEEFAGCTVRTTTIKAAYHPYCSRANAQSPAAANGLCVPMDSPFWLTGWQSGLMSTAMTGDFRPDSWDASGDAVCRCRSTWCRKWQSLAQSLPLPALRRPRLFGARW